MVRGQHGCYGGLMRLTATTGRLLSAVVTVCAECVVSGNPVNRCVAPAASFLQAEETQAADMAGPLSLVATIVSGAVVGIAFLLAVTFSIQDPTTVTATTINPVFNIAWEAFAAR